MNKNNIKTISAISASIVLLVSVFVLFLYILMGKGEAEIIVYPPDTRYIINSKEYSGNQTLILRTGKYVALFSRELFQDHKETFSIKKNSRTTLEIILEPSDRIINLQKIIQGEELEYIDSAEQALFQKSREDFINKNPIAEELPLIFEKYRVDYTTVGNGKIRIEITIFTEYLVGDNKENLKKEALEKINNYNISEKDIDWFFEPKG